MSKMFREAFEKLKNRQVASVIHYTVHPKDKKQGELYTATDLIDAFNQAAESKPLIHRRTWFKIDSCTLDKDLAKKVSQILVDQDDVIKTYAALEKNPDPKQLEKCLHEETKDDVEDSLTESLPPIIHLEFNDAATADDLINMTIPFERLREDLLRLNRALDRSGRGTLNDVTVVHTSLYSKTLSQEQLRAINSP